MIIAVSDTHTAIWYLSADSRLSVSAKAFIDTTAENGDEIGLSAITFVEIVYLVEKGRISAQEFTRLAGQIGDIESAFVEIPIDLKVARALSRVNVEEIPDMPDRIIAATAMHLGIPLITRDNRIKLSSIATIW